MWCLKFKKIKVVMHLGDSRLWTETSLQILQTAVPKGCD